MKKLLGLAVIGFVLFNFAFVFGAEKDIVGMNIGTSVFTISKGDDSKKQDNPYLLIENKNIGLKIYPCGRVTKETWKEINPNEEDTSEYLTFSDGTTTLNSTRYIITR